MVVLVGQLYLVGEMSISGEAEANLFYTCECNKYEKSKVYQGLLSVLQVIYNRFIDLRYVLYVTKFVT